MARLNTRGERFILQASGRIGRTDGGCCCNTRCLCHDENGDIVGVMPDCCCVPEGEPGSCVGSPACDCQPDSGCCVNGRRYYFNPSQINLASGAWNISATHFSQGFCSCGGVTGSSGAIQFDNLINIGGPCNLRRYMHAQNPSIHSVTVPSYNVKCCNGTGNCADGTSSVLPQFQWWVYYGEHGTQPVDFIGTTGQFGATGSSCSGPTLTYIAGGPSTTAVVNSYSYSEVDNGNGLMFAWGFQSYSETEAGIPSNFSRTTVAFSGSVAPFYICPHAELPPISEFPPSQTILGDDEVFL